MWRTRGKCKSPSRRVRVRWASASNRTSLLIGGDEMSVHQSRGRYMEERPCVRCLEESWALKMEREGKE